MNESADTELGSYLSKQDSMDVQVMIEASDNSQPREMDSCSSPVGPFTCGGCGSSLHTACGLHVHMTTNHSWGSYHYDNLMKIAFPKYDSCCASTQTSKHDKLYLHKYKISRSGNPPKKVYGVKIESEIRDKYVVIKEDEEEHTTQMQADVKKEQLPSKSLTTYNLRHTRRTNQFKGRDCYVKLKPLKNDKGHRRTKDKDTIVQKRANKSDSDHTQTLTMDAAVAVVVKTEQVDILEEPTVDDDKFDDYDMLDDNDDDVWEDIPQFLAESTTDITAGSQDLLGSYSEMENNTVLNSIDSNDTQTLLSQRKTPRKCKNVVSLLEECGRDDDSDASWSPNVEKQKKKRKPKNSPHVHSSKPAENGVRNDTDTLDETDVKKSKLEIKMMKRRLRIREQKRKDSKKKFMCDICGQLIRKTNKEPHMNEHLGIKPYVCDVCAQSFLTHSRLINHMARHDLEKGIGRYNCDVCGKVYLCSDAYGAHMNKHRGLRPFQCDKCDTATFTSMKNLKTHISKVHTFRKPVSCSICGKEYSNKVSLNNHMIAAHTKPKLPCRYCSRMFHMVKVRANHELTHTGEKPYICCVCNHGFIQWTPYLEHMLKKHGYSRVQVVDMAEKKKKDAKAPDNITNSAVDGLPDDHPVVSTSNDCL